jgi:hypothetical protein
MEVEQVVLTVLAKDHEQRFGSVQTFAKALAQALEQVEVVPQSSLASSAQPTELCLMSSPSRPAW